MNIEFNKKGVEYTQTQLDIHSKVKNNDIQKPIRTIHEMNTDHFFNDEHEEDNLFNNEEEKKEFEELLEATNEIIFGENTHFEFQIHEKTGSTLVRLVDNKTKEVIKEIPPKKILDVMAGIWELAGMIVDEKA